MTPLNASTPSRLCEKRREFTPYPLEHGLGPERRFLRRVETRLLVDCALFTADGSPFHQFVNFMHKPYMQGTSADS
jgi:hypothetical protein